MVSNPGFALHEDSGVASVLSTPEQARMLTFNRMAFTSYGYDKMNRQLWATMPPILCRDVRDAAIRAVLTDF